MRAQEKRAVFSIHLFDCFDQIDQLIIRRCSKSGFTLCVAYIYTLIFAIKYYHKKKIKQNDGCLELMVSEKEEKNANIHTHERAHTPRRNLFAFHYKLFGHSATPRGQDSPRLMDIAAPTEEIVFSFSLNRLTLTLCTCATVQVKHGYFSFHYRPQHNFSIKGVYGKILTFYTIIFFNNLYECMASYDL